MGDREVITINRSEEFGLGDVRSILPVVRRITQEFSEKVELLIARLESLPLNQNDLICSIEDQINDLMTTWNEKIRKLGAEPKGLWVVDFDFGQGYYCWKFPETDILFWHAYEDGYTGRKPLEDLCAHKHKGALINGASYNASTAEKEDPTTVSSHCHSPDQFPAG